MCGTQAGAQARTGGGAGMVAMAASTLANRRRPQSGDTPAQAQAASRPQSNPQTVLGSATSGEASSASGQVAPAAGGKKTLLGQ